VKLALQILAGLAFPGRTPAAATAWLFALTSAGKSGAFGWLVLIGIPVGWCLVAGALLLWYGVPWAIVLSLWAVGAVFIALAVSGRF
jgi:hypothetical protein